MGAYRDRLTWITTAAAERGYLATAYNLGGGDRYEVTLTVQHERVPAARRKPVHQEDIPLEMARLLAEVTVDGLRRREARDLTWAETLDRIAHPHGTYDPDASYVTAAQWSISYEQECYVPGYSRPREELDPTVKLGVIAVGERGVIEHPEHHGKTFPTANAAYQYALDHGLIRLAKPRARKRNAA